MASGKSRDRAPDDDRTAEITVLVRHLEEVIAQLNVIVKAARQVTRAPGSRPPVRLPRILVGEECRPVPEGRGGQGGDA